MDFAYFIKVLKRRWKLNTGILLFAIFFQFMLVYFEGQKWQSSVTFKFLNPKLPNTMTTLEGSKPVSFNPGMANKIFKKQDFLDAYSENCLKQSNSSTLSRDEIQGYLNSIETKAVKDNLTATITTSDQKVSELLMESLIKTLPEELAKTYRQTIEKLKQNLTRQDKFLSNDISNTKILLAAIRNKDPREYVPRDFDHELNGLQDLVVRLKTQLDNFKELRESTIETINKIESTSPTERLEKNISDSSLEEFVKKQRWNILNTQVKILQEKATKTDIHPDIVKLKEELHNTTNILKTLLNPEGEMFPYVATIYKTAQKKAHAEYNSFKTRVAELTNKIENTKKELNSALQKVSNLNINYLAYKNYFDHLGTLCKRKKIVSSAKEELHLAQINPPDLVKFFLPLDKPKNTGVTFTDILYIGTLLSLLISIGACYLFELIDQRFFDLDQLRAAFKIPILSVIPHITGKTKRPPPESSRQSSILLLQKLKELFKTPISVVITSHSSKEGSTLVAEELAVTAAEMEDKVLLIKYSRSSSSFPALNYKGGLLSHSTDTHRNRRKLLSISTGKRIFSDFLFIHGIEKESSLPIIKTQTPGLFLLPTGENWFFQKKTRVKSLLSEAEKQFDLIIFDTPAASTSSCSTTLGNIADGLVLVLRAGKASATKTRELLRNWDGTGINLIGFVLNDLKETGKSFQANTQTLSRISA